MRILHVIQTIEEEFGGPAWTLAALAKAQAAAGHQVTVLTARRNHRSTTLKLGLHEGVNFVEAPLEHEVLIYSRHLRDTVERHVREADIVHVHVLWRYHLAATAWACRKWKIPYIVRPAGVLGIPLRRGKWYFKAPYFWLRERPAINRAAAIHCTSETERDELRGLALRARKFVLPNALPISQVDLSVPLTATHPSFPNIGPQDRVILSLGRISWKKQLHILVEAFTKLSAEFATTKLVLAGPHQEPSVVKQLQQLAANANIADRVLIPGMVVGEAKEWLFRRAEVFAMPSLHENFGIAAAEALAYGVPCIVSRGVALGGLIESASAGITCEATADSFHFQLQRLLSSPGMRQGFSAEASELVARYRPDLVCDKIIAEYRCHVRED